MLDRRFPRARDSHDTAPDRHPRASHRLTSLRDDVSAAPGLVVIAPDCAPLSDQASAHGMNRAMIVAIDGPAGSGKSTVAFELARRLGFVHLDTGAMYRALAWLAARDGVDVEDGAALARLARENPISFDDRGRVEIAGEDVSADIRGAEIDRLVPLVARHPEVREVMRERQRSLGSVGNAVIEGRDIGSVVAPDAEVKVFLVADEAERVRRRSADRPETSAESLAAELRRRDERDAVNTQPADDAVLLDTTDLTVDEVVLRIAELVEARR